MKIVFANMDPLQLVTPVMDSEDEHSIEIEQSQKRQLQDDMANQCSHCAKSFTFTDRIDEERLIALVFQRPAVWDRKSKMHGNRNIVDKCWSEISREMKYDEIELKKKWKYLRDQFAVELGKFSQSRSGAVAGDTQPPRWRYFKLLMFLKDFVKPRPSNCKLSDVLTSDTAAPGLFHKEDDPTDDIEPPMLSEEKSNQCSHCTKRFTKRMNMEGLIACVFQRPAVWDRKSKMHSNRNIVDKSWSEISSEMKFDEKECRKKWKYLRDQFAVELGKFPHFQLGACDTHTSKWRYFPLLMFLKDVVKPRASTENLSDVLTSDSEEGLVTSPTSPPQTQDTPVHKEINKRPKLQYLLEKSTQNQDKEDDEDMMFFKSLLPHIKNIPDSKKLRFRNRIQEVVEQFAYQFPLVSPNPNSPPSYSGHTPQSSSPSSSSCPSSPDPPNYDTESFSETYAVFQNVDK